MTRGSAILGRLRSGGGVPELRVEPRRERVVPDRGPRRGDPVAELRLDPRAQWRECLVGERFLGLVAEVQVDEFVVADREERHELRGVVGHDVAAALGAEHDDADPLVVVPPEREERAVAGRFTDGQQARVRRCALVEPPLERQAGDERGTRIAAVGVRTEDVPGRRIGTVAPPLEPRPRAFEHVGDGGPAGPVLGEFAREA